MLMAETPIITGEVKKQNNMAFKMRSGNKVSFKNMGSSPVKQKDYSIKQSEGEGPTRDFDNTSKSGSPNPPLEGFTERKLHANIEESNMEHGKRKLDKIALKPPVSPAKQKLNKGGEGQDQDKIFNSKGEHIGDYVNDKPVMKPGFKRPVVKKDAPVKPKEGDMEKYSDLEKYDDDRPVSPNKQKQQSSRKDKGSELQTSELGKKVKAQKAFKAWEKGSTGANQMLNKRADVLKTLKKVTKTKVPKGAKSIEAASNYEKDFKKIYDALLEKGYHYSKGVNVLSPNKQVKTKGLGPRTAFGGVKNPELTKTKKPFSTKVMKDGPKKQVTGIDLGKDPNWQPHPDAFKTKKKK